MIWVRSARAIAMGVRCRAVCSSIFARPVLINLTEMIQRAQPNCCALAHTSHPTTHRLRLDPSSLLTLPFELLLIFYETLETYRRYRRNLWLYCSYFGKRGDYPCGNVDKHKDEQSDLRKRPSG